MISSNHERIYSLAYINTVFKKLFIIYNIIIMTQENNLPVRAGLPVKQMLLGAGFALVFISLFLSGVTDPKREWGNLWMVRPLIVVPIAGAMGGAFFYYITRLTKGAAWGILLGIAGSIVILWLGTVAGLDGTLWD